MFDDFCDSHTRTCLRLYNKGLPCKLNCLTVVQLNLFLMPYTATSFCNLVPFHGYAVNVEGYSHSDVHDSFQ